MRSPAKRPSDKCDEASTNHRETPTFIHSSVTILINLFAFKHKDTRKKIGLTDEAVKKKSRDIRWFLIILTLKLNLPYLSVPNKKSDESSESRTDASGCKAGFEVKIKKIAFQFPHPLSNVLVTQNINLN